MPVAGIKDRKTNKVVVKIVSKTNRATLHNFVEANTTTDAIVCTDEALAYRGINRPHLTGNHRAKQYGNEMAHTNGMESFWAGLERSYYETYLHMSGKHVHRYVMGLAYRHNERELDTETLLCQLARLTVVCRLRLKELIA